MLRGKVGEVDVPSHDVPSYGEVLRAPVFLPVFVTSTLSTWGDYIARITVAAVVFEWTGSALATAATFAVYLVPSNLYIAYALAPWLLLTFIAGVTGEKPWRWAAVFALLIFRLNRASRTAGLVAAGLYAASYRFSGAWMDIARADSLFLFLILGAF